MLLLVDCEVNNQRRGHCQANLKLHCGQVVQGFTKVGRVFLEACINGAKGGDHLLAEPKLLRAFLQKPDFFRGGA